MEKTWNRDGKEVYEIQIVDGVTLMIDPEKYDVKNALRLQLPEGDLLLTFDLNITDILQNGESKVQNIAALRSK